MEFIKSTWFLLTMLGISTILVFVWLHIFNKKKLNAGILECIIVSLIHTLYGVLTVKFFAFLEVGFDRTLAGNMSLFGGIFFMPIMYFLYAIIKKLPFSLVFDIFVIPLCLTLALARVNCLYAGCCIGHFIGTTKMRYPTREADLLIHVVF